MPRKIIKSILRSLVGANHKPNTYGRVSYSQCGEDVIMNHLLTCLGIENPSYFDIGAHHPWKLSNSCYFYNRGGRGINVEPDPFLFKEFLVHRKGDINLNIGIGNESGTLDFYVMNPRTLSTFSKSEVIQYENEYGYKVKDTLKVSVETIEDIIDKYWDGKFPDILSLDVEGLDLEIIKSINYSKSSPKVICVETISYSERGDGKKNGELINHLLANGYFLYADTYINSIFVIEELWKDRD